MKYFLLSFLFASSIFANVNNAFKAFYFNEKISFNHCGKNIQHFLKYLEEKNVTYNSGYVVSLHEPMGSLHHFDARWGKVEKYKNGIEYSRSNWYFHVFLVIDGVAYDFSQAGVRTQPLKDYLITSYLPKFETRPIFMSGELTKEKMLNTHFSLKLKIYNTEDYKNKLGPVKYEGSLIEMFLKLDNPEQINSDVNYDKANVNQDGSVTVLNPSLNTENGIIPFLTYADKICHVLGFAGSFTNKFEYKITDNLDALHVYSSIKSDLTNPKLKIKYSYKIKKTNSAVKRDLFHIATKVTCGNLNNFFN